MTDHERFMREALREALSASRAGEVPIGAVIVKDGRVIGRGHNRVESLADPTAHAEIIAIGAAAESLGSWRLEETTLYCTVEPCLMCAGAMIHARIPTLVFGARDPKFGAVRSILRALEDERFNHQVEVIEGVMADECKDILRKFFERARRTDG